MTEGKFEIGDCVLVNKGVIDPDFKNDIGGWQGRVKEPEEDGIVVVAWDSVTLKQMGMESIVRCEMENLDWEVTGLSVSELSEARCRDTEEDVGKAVAAIRARLLKDPRLRDIFGPGIEEDR